MQPETADLASLSHRVDVLERVVFNRDQSHDDHSKILNHLQAQTDKVLAFSRQMFPIDASVATGSDFETGEHFFVVTVKASGSPKDLAALFKLWHQRLWTELGHASQFYRLVIVPQ